MANNHRNTEIVRLAYRLMAQGASWLIVVVSLLHLFMFLYWHAPGWQWPLIVVAGTLSLLGTTRPETPLGVFLFAHLLVFALLANSLIQLTQIYGSAAGYHYLLLLALPMVVLSGRLSEFSKWLLFMLLLPVLMILDQTPPDTQLLSTLPAALIPMTKIVNISTLALAMTGLSRHYFHIVTDQQKNLLQLAHKDALTGLLNRRRLLEVIEQTLLQANRYEQPVSFILCDLDHFKMINDRYGHNVGDEVLRHASQILHNCIRETDSVGRWGGEEFLVILPQTRLSVAVTLAERIAQTLAKQPAVQNPRPVTVTMTLGVASYRKGELFEATVARADDALYVGKANGRNRVVVEDNPAGNHTETTEADCTIENRASTQEPI